MTEPFLQQTFNTVVIFNHILYSLYIDESGDEGFIANPENKQFADWFTTGGIIVRDENIVKFEKVYDFIIQKYFTDNDIQLPSNFKLHYHQLRRGAHPYDQLLEQQRWDITNTMFNSINTIDCKLVSVTINKPNLVAKYDRSVNVRAFTLLTCMERFQYFLEEQNAEGKIIYERFSVQLRKRMNREMQKLQDVSTFSHVKKLDKIRGKKIRK